MKWLNVCRVVHPSGSENPRVDPTKRSFGRTRCLLNLVLFLAAIFIPTDTTDTYNYTYGVRYLCASCALTETLSNFTKQMHGSIWFTLDLRIQTTGSTAPERNVRNPTHGPLGSVKYLLYIRSLYKESMSWYLASVLWICLITC